MYKVDTKTLKKITKLLDKVKFPLSPAGGRKNPLQIEAEELSQHIKDNYTQIKPQ